MPTYEYKNIETGEIYEFKQSMRDDAFTHHPDTGAAIKRIVSVPGIAFKGSGFYANDSRSTTSSGKAGGSSAGNAKTEIAGGSGESKSAESSAGSSEGASKSEAGKSTSTAAPASSAGGPSSGSSGKGGE